MVFFINNNRNPKSRNPARLHEQILLFYVHLSVRNLRFIPKLSLLGICLIGFILSEGQSIEKKLQLHPWFSVKEVADKVMAERAAIIGGKHIFAGPLKDTAGNEKVAAGATLDVGGLWKMDWFVPGVITQK